MAVKRPGPEWYVYVENYNKRTIEKFNVFHSVNFLNGCRKTFKRFKDIKEIEEEIRRWALYSFWSKCEYEVLIQSWTSHPDRFKPIKIDVYDQLMLNWDSFFKYTFEHRAYFLRRKP